MLLTREEALEYIVTGVVTGIVLMVSIKPVCLLIKHGGIIVKGIFGW